MPCCLLAYLPACLSTRVPPARRRSFAIEFPSIKPKRCPPSHPQNVLCRPVKTHVGGYSSRVIVSCPSASNDESSIAPPAVDPWQIYPSGTGRSKKGKVRGISPWSGRRIPAARETENERNSRARAGGTGGDPRCNKFRAGKNGTVGYERLMERRAKVRAREAAR